MYLQQAISIFPQNNTIKLNDQITILKNTILALKDHNMATESQEHDYALYFLLQSYVNDPQNNSILELIFTNPLHEKLQQLFTQMTKDKDFISGYNQFITDKKNLTFIFNLAIQQTTKHYADTRMTSSTASELSKNLTTALIDPTATSKKKNIQTVRSYLSSKTTGKLHDWLKPYYITYMQNMNILPMTTYHTVYLRPDHLQKAIKKSFQDTVNKQGRTYIKIGQPEYAFNFNALHIDSQRIINTLGNKNFTILDIGTGSGSFIFPINRRYKNIEAFGITATDLRNPESQKDDSHYIIANAEYLNNVFPRETFDFIFSQTTYCHLTDPIGAIIQAYDCLKFGGILMIDYFILKDCEGYLDNIIHYLQEKGYKILAQSNQGEIHNFIIQKTLPTLELPISYVQNETGAIYKPLPSIKKDDGSSFLPAINNGKKEISTWIEQHNLNPILTKHSTLEELLFSDAYREQDFDNKYYLILATVAKTYDYNHYCKDFQNFQTKLPASLFVFLNHLKTNPQLDSLHLLFLEDEFHRQEFPTKLQLISLVAFFNIMQLGQKSLDKKMLQEMNLPFKELRPGYYAPISKHDTRLQIDPPSSIKAGFRR